MSGVGGGDGTRAARLGDPGTPLVDPHRDGTRLGAGRDDLQVDVGHLGAERRPGRRRPRRRRPRRRAGCRARGGRPGGRDRSRAASQSAGRTDGFGGAHGHAGQDGVRFRPGEDSTTRRPASVAMRDGAGRDAGPGRPGLGQAADAVAAHLGPAAVGVVQHHAHVGPTCRSGDADDEPVGADAPPPVAEAPGHVAERGLGQRLVVEQHEEVVAETMVLGQRQTHAEKAPITSGTATSGSSSMSIQWTRGSRRNHRSWRTAKRRVRATAVAAASSREHAPCRWDAAARRSRSPGPPSGTGRRGAPSGPAPRRGSPRRAAVGTGRSMRRSSSGPGPAQADLDDGRRRVAVEARAEGAERPAAADADLEGPHHAAPVRRAPSWRHRPDRAPRSRSWSTRRVGFGLQVGPHPRPRPRRLEPIDDGAQVEPGPADEQRPGAARRDVGHRDVVGATERHDGELLGRVDQVDAVVTNLGLLGRGRPWPCRCPCRDTPGRRRRTRSRCRRSPGRRPWPPPTSPTPWAR